MDVREKLIYLLTGYSIDTQPDVEYLADHLISNVITIMQHGQWEHTKLEDEEWGVWHKWTCDNCGYYVVRNPRGTNFCPNCGARMS